MKKFSLLTFILCLITFNVDAGFFPCAVPNPPMVDNYGFGIKFVIDQEIENSLFFCTTYHFGKKKDDPRIEKMKEKRLINALIRKLKHELQNNKKGF